MSLLHAQAQAWARQHAWFGTHYLEAVADAVDRQVSRHRADIETFSGTTGAHVALSLPADYALQGAGSAPLPVDLVTHPANIYFHGKRSRPRREPISQFVLKARVRAWNRQYSPVRLREESPLIAQPTPHNCVLMGLDPGTRNFGYWVGAFTGDERGVKTIRPLESNMLSITFDDFNGADLNLVSFRFRQQLQSIMLRHRVQRVVMERFMTRGFGGDLIEKVGVMLGLAMAAATDIVGPAEMRAVNSSSWKNRLKPYLDLKATYPTMSVPIHQLDAALMALGHYPCDQPYAYLKRHRRSYLEMFDA